MGIVALALRSGWGVVQGGRTGGARTQHEGGAEEMGAGTQSRDLDKMAEAATKRDPAAAPKATAMRSPGKLMTKCT